MKVGKIDERGFIQKLRPETRLVVLTGADILQRLHNALQGRPDF